ncbi:hypothetical protein CEXT_361071 [Caerostris extrusa]|uniref:Uncharacterized protein n=1 Tax=Caerostris extrusa TaxID=172846 RepID=A0AAV4PJ22_CAEEX|nr:hypothetical protein CEXT_361071 [Caerostris extrusa]
MINYCKGSLEDMQKLGWVTSLTLLLTTALTFTPSQNLYLLLGCSAPDQRVLQHAVLLGIAEEKRVTLVRSPRWVRRFEQAIF